MKPHYTEAPDKVRRLADKKAEAASQQGPKISAARAWTAMLAVYRAHGFVVRPEDIPMPATARFQSLTERANTDPNARGDLTAERVWLVAESKRERFVRSRAEALGTWASAPTAEEQGKLDAAERARVAEEQAIEERAQAILADQNQKALEKARQQARKELNGAA